MHVSIIVSTYNRRKTVLRTVAMLLSQEYPLAEYEVIVVDDGSVDGTTEALRQLASRSRLRVIEQENLGPSGARNAGAREASGELLIFVDDDMTCGPGLVRAHVAAHFEQKGIVGLGAILVAPEHPPNLAAEYFGTGLGRVYLQHSDAPGDPWPEGVWSFANTSIRREELMQAGGFDERFRMREDAELGVRLSAAGIQPRFVADAIAYQWCGKSAADLVRDSEAFAEADFLFMRTHPGKTPHEFVRRLEHEGNWKRRLRELVAGNLDIADLLLAPFCALGERFHSISPLRMLGVRALQIRCGLHWYHRVLELAADSTHD